MNSVCMKYRGASNTCAHCTFYKYKTKGCVATSVTFSAMWTQSSEIVIQYLYTIFAACNYPDFLKIYTYYFLISLYLTGCLSHSQICHQQSQVNLLEFVLLTSTTQCPVRTASGSHIEDIVTSSSQKWKGGLRLLQTASNMVSLSCYTSAVKLYRAPKLMPFILFRWITGQYWRSIRARIHPSQCQNVSRRFQCILDWTV